MTPIPNGLTDSASCKYKTGAFVTQKYILKPTDATYKYYVDDDKQDGSDEEDGLLLLIRQSGIGLPLGFHHDPSFLLRLCSPAPQPETSQVGPSLSLSLSLVVLLDLYVNTQAILCHPSSQQTSVGLGVIETGLHSYLNISTTVTY